MKMKKPNELQQESTNKKRLLSGCPKPNLAAPVCENKKTRDLPNLSECQACGFRIDACTGKSKIQILYSEWRIVLLCKKCLSSVESSQICSYCFKETIKDFFTCCQCKRCVHRNCFLKYRTVPPWSYSCASVEFSVCVDCWVPKSMMKRRGYLRRRTGGYNSTDLENSNSRVLKGGGHCARSSEDTVKDAICAPGKTIVLALMAPIKVGSNALDSVVKRDGDGGNDNEAVVDDSELAFKLHRAMNSSRRITKNVCTVRNPKIRECNNDLVLRDSDSGNPSVSCDLEICAEKKLNENLDRSVLDPVVFVKDGYVALQSKEGEGSCSNKLVRSSGDENSMNFESKSYQLNQYESTTCKVYKAKPDRYLFKYRKRNSRCKRFPNDKSRILYERFPHQGKPLAAGLSLNCSTESRTFSNGSLQSCAFPLQASTCVSGLSPDDS